MGTHNLGNNFRQRRMRRFLSLIAILGDRQLKILDIGGTPQFWHALPALYKRPNVSITVINLDAEEREDENILIRKGDARALAFPDQSFDVVHSNSVIEHVGHWRDMERMASEVRRVAPNYFIQTPNFWFPIEPHFKLPIVHWLPEHVRPSLVWHRRGKRFNDIGEATLHVQRIQLLSAAQMRFLFPDAHLWRERVFGMTKSMVAEKFPGITMPRQFERMTSSFLSASGETDSLMIMPDRAR